MQHLQITKSTPTTSCIFELPFKAGISDVVVDDRIPGKKSTKWID